MLYSKFRIIILIFFCPFILNAQNFEGGLSFGLITYQGDLVDNFVELKETNLSYGIALRAVLTDKIAIRSNFYRGLLSGDDANSSISSRQARNLRFKTQINELTLLGEWNFLGQGRTDIRGSVLRQKFSPYFFAGVGIILFDPQVSQGATLNPEGSDYETFNICIPIGMGIKIGLDERFVLSLEGGGRTAFSDYLDGVSKLGNSSNNDWYWMGNLIITYTFGAPNYF